MTDGPDQGHTFRITVQSRGSYRIQGDEQYHDEPDFSGPPWVQEVRAWSLMEALRRAQDIPFATWAESAYDPDEVCACGNRFDGDNLCMRSACQMET